MSDQDSLTWARNVCRQLCQDESKALRVDRSGYAAFVRYDPLGRYNYQLIHRHYHNDEWSSDAISHTHFMSIAAPYSDDAEVVEMPDLGDVEVTRPGGEWL